MRWLFAQLLLIRLLVSCEAATDSTCAAIAGSWECTLCSNPVNYYTCSPGAANITILTAEITTYNASLSVGNFSSNSGAKYGFCGAGPSGTYFISFWGPALNQEVAFVTFFWSPQAPQQASIQWAPVVGKTFNGNCSRVTPICDPALLYNQQVASNLPPTPQDYAESCPNFHEYSWSTMVCEASWHCTRELLTEALLLYAFPGQDPHYPVVNGGLYNAWFLNEGGPIKVFVKDTLTGPLVENWTEPGHILFNGIVMRYISQAADKSWVLTTYGRGINNGELYQWMNQYGGPLIFSHMDESLISYLKCVLSGRPKAQCV